MEILNRDILPIFIFYLVKLQSREYIVSTKQAHVGTGVSRAPQFEVGYVAAHERLITWSPRSQQNKFTHTSCGH